MQSSSLEIFSHLALLQKTAVIPHVLQPHLHKQPFVYLEEGWAEPGHGTRSTSSPWTMLHAPCWHSQWSSSEHSSQLCQKKLRLKPWELPEQSTRTPRWVFCTEISKSQAPLKSYLSSSCCRHPLPASGNLWMVDWGYHTRSHAVCHTVWLQRTFTNRRQREQRACLPPKRVCTGGADLDSPLAGSPWAFSGSTQPKVHLLLLWVFPLRVMPLVLSSISCFLPWQLPC